MRFVGHGGERGTCRVRIYIYNEPGRDGKILYDHRKDGNDEVHRL